MKIKLDNFSGNLNHLMRKLGYHPLKGKKESFVKKIRGSKFPRFHIYVNGDELNLHLDQKPARYKSGTDHAGEYDTPLVKKEAERIKSYVTDKTS